MNSRRLTRPPHPRWRDQDISDDLAQGARAFAASRLQVPNRVKGRPTQPSPHLRSQLPLTPGTCTTR